MKKINKLLSVVLTFCMMLVITASIIPNSFVNAEDQSSELSGKNLAINDVPESIGYRTAVGRGHVQRLRTEENDLNTAVFENSDGTRSMYYFGDNIKYIDSNGSIRDKSNNLTRVSRGFTNTANDINVFYPDDITRGLDISYDSINIKMMPIGVAENVITAEPANVIGGNMSLNDIADKVVYENIFGQSSRLVYTQTLNGTKEEIVLESDIGKMQFSFAVYTGGLELMTDGGKLLLSDRETDQTVAEFGEIVMWDSSGVYRNGEYIVQPSSENRDQYIITIDASVLLNNDEIVFPVTIDPSVKIWQTSTTAIEDASIFTNYNQNFGGWLSLFVGNYDRWSASSSNVRGKARSLVKFPGLMTNDTFLYLRNAGTILSIKYNFADIDCGSGPNTINAYLATTSWSESTVKYSGSLWNAYGVYVGSTTISPTTPMPLPYPRYEIDITTAVDLWLSGGKPNYGIMLKSTDESKEAVVLGASESGSGSVGGRSDSRPYVVVNYSEIRRNLIYRLKNAGSGLYMTVANGYHRDKMNIYQSALSASANDRAAQEFRLTYDSSANAYRIRPLCSMNGRDKVLDVVKSASGVAGLTSGCNVQTYEAVDNIAELFDIESCGDNKFKIVLRYATNLAISAVGTSSGTISGTSSTSAGNIIVSEYTGADSQKWILERSDQNEKQLYYSLMNINYPFKGSDLPTHITSGFGHRIPPIDGGNSNHAGIDIRASSGAALYSLFDGIVIEIGYNSVRGNYIIVEAVNDCNNVYGTTTKLRFVYMHLKESPTITNSNVVMNARVTTTTQIGKVGTTGSSTGNHLHLSFIIDGNTSTNFDKCMNPMAFYPNINFTYSVD